MKLGLYANTQKPHVREIVRQLNLWKQDKDITFSALQPFIDFLQSGTGFSPDLESGPDPYPGPNWIRAQAEHDFRHQNDMVLVLGGDGTMLAAARFMESSRTPLLGVNLGSLGFLAEVTMATLTRRMDEVVKGAFEVQKRMVLLATCQSSGKEHRFNALNDVVIHRGGTSRILKIDVQVNRQYFNIYHADGLIVATPTGSTAYSLSANGPILMPEMDAMILNPICPHTLTVRPAVIPGDDEVTIRILPTDNPASLTVDGQVNIALDAQTEITVRKADHVLHSVTFPDSGFFDLLRRKLHWGDLERK
ncbi:NAD(+)/NADH kinase [bacterium]|nr:NAD(+)/NADH kinase [bacterium]